MHRSSAKNPARASGFITSYVLTGILLLSIAIAGIAAMNRGGDSGKRQEQVRQAISGQVDLIRSKLISCVVVFPSGDNGTGFRSAYPGTPASGLVSDLVCPGEGALWPGGDGVSLPPQPRGFGQWNYANDASSIRITIELDGSDPRDRAGATHAARRFGPDASIVGDSFSFVLVR